jgi:cation-transporting ATPase E
MGLANKKVLIQELPAVEGLARVDVVCFDKTGTLTEGEIDFDALELVGNASLGHEAVLAYFGNDPDANATARCLKGNFAGHESLRHTSAVEFTSAQKWSSFTFENSGTWTLGAPEFVLDKKHAAVLARAGELAALGRRTLVLANEGQPIALVTFRERIRPDAAATVAYFREQGVSIRIISGDNPQTVTAVAREAGVEFEGEGFDARNLPEDIEALAEIMERFTVFGRVTPEQKRNMVEALQLRGHVVAMTGDGVNDALALKKADMGIAMGSGSPATKAVSNLVLLDGKFSNLPGVVAEGRKVIANIERVSKLFLTKTTWALTLALSFGILAWKFPFLPRQLSGVDSFTIGLPAFALALLPNPKRYEPGFLGRALRFVIPSGLAVAAGVIALNGVALNQGWEQAQSQTATMIMMSTAGIWVLSTLARPIDRAKAWIFVSMVSLGVAIFNLPLATGYFGFVAVSGEQMVWSFGLGLAASLLIEVANRITRAKS